MWGKASRGGARRRKPALLISVAATSFAVLLLSAAPAMALPRTTAVALAATGDTYTWTGAGSATNTYWSNAQNWTCSGAGCTSGSTPISDSPSDVVFPASPTGGNYAPSIDQSAEVNSLTMDSHQYGITGSGSLTVDGATQLEGTIFTQGSNQTYDGPVTVEGSDVTDGASTFDGLVTFNSTVDGSVAGGAVLYVPCATVFDAPVGASVPLWAVDDGGSELPKTIDTSVIDAVRVISLTGPVTLQQDTTLNAQGLWLGAMNGAYSLTANGDTSLRGDIGDTTPLTQLTVNGGATLAGNATTTGSQAYAQGLYMSAFRATSALSGSAVSFGGPLTTDDGSVTISGTATLGDGGSQIDDLSVGGSLTISGGTLELTGNLDVGGTLDASGASVNLDGDGTQQLQGSGVTFGALNIVGGSNLDLNGTSATAGGLTGGGGVADSGAAATLTLSPSAADSFGGAISGPVSLVMDGTGSLNLTGALDYSGTTSVSSGTLNFQADPAELSGISDDGEVGFDVPGDATFSGVISGSGGVTQSGSGILTLNGANTYAGGTTIDAGTIRFFNAGNLGTGNITLNGGGLQWGTGNYTDISDRLNPLGPNGGTIDTGGDQLMFLSPITGSGSLTITGAGSVAFTSSNTYSGATTVESGSAAFWKNLAGALNVGSGASAVAEGIVSGPVTVNDGTLTCDNGTLSGGVTNNGGTLLGAPQAPTGATATPGTRQATVSFTPGTSNCYPISYTATASPGGQTGTGSSSPITVSGLGDDTSYTFTVTETNPVGSATSAASAAALTAPGDPTARISSPGSGGQYRLNQAVPTSFSCTDAAGGPGIATCRDSNGATGGTGRLDTSTLGLHVYTVTATSQDGQRGAASITYTVVSPTPPPPNKFTLTASNHTLISSCGISGLKLGLPGAGVVKAVETFAPHASVFGRARASATKAEMLKLTLKPNRRGARLIKRHRRLKLTLRVSFTPVGGTTRVRTISGIRLPGECRAPR